jgi:hypothetical protein
MMVVIRTARVALASAFNRAFIPAAEIVADAFTPAFPLLSATVCASAGSAAAAMTAIDALTATIIVKYFLFMIF